MPRPTNDALTDLIQRYRGLIRSILHRSVRDPAEREEVEQEIVVKLWNSMERFDPERAKESTFVAMLARRCIIDFHRARARRPTPEPIEAASHVGTTDADAAVFDEDVRRLADAMEEIPAERARMIEASFHRGMTHREIAARTGISLGTVKSHLRRGLQELRARLETVGAPTAA